MTFYHGEGAERFNPQKWDRIFGDYLSLPLIETNFGETYPQHIQK